ncbi:hypothetical protein R6Q57_013310 [Mikania cordata]
MDKQYSSQPVDKPSKWILSKWRRPNCRNETSPDKCNEMKGEGNDESEKWSTDAIEFFNTGDSSFCYSAVFYKSEKLDKRFWGTLLGYCSNGYLTPNHIEGWAGRLINWRCREVQQDWSLIMIDLNSLDLVMYNNKRIYGDRYRERVHPSLKKIAVYFTALVNIRYWKV